jgi:hypothetical membrane protein
MGTLGRCLLGAFVAICAAMHFVRADLSPVGVAVSFYMNGHLGWLMGAGIVAMGTGSLLIVLRLPRMSRAGVVLLSIWGIAVIFAGIFPPDAMGHWNRPPTTSGLIHGMAAMMAFPAFAAASVLLSSGGALRVLAWLSVISLVVFFVSLAPAFINRPPHFLGLTERVLLALYLAWMFLASVQSEQRSA